MRQLTRVLPAILLVAGTMVGTSVPAVAQTKLTVGIGNYRPPQYHSFYLAQELGYFADEGLDVEFQIISGAGATIQQLIAGNIDVAVCSPAALLNAVASGQGDMLTPYSYWYKNIFTLASPTSSGITELGQLKDKIVGVSEASGGEIPFVRGAMAGAGLADGVDYQMLPIGDGGQLTYDALASGKAQAYSSSLFDVAAVSAAGLPLTDITPDKFAYVPSININVTRDTWDSRNEDIIKFARAVTKGTIFAQTNPDAANAILAEIAPEIYEDEALAQAIWDTTVASMQPPAEYSLDPNTELGTNILPIWENYVSFVSQGTAEEGALPGPVDLSQIVVNDAIPAINDFDHAAIVQQAENWQP